jgi:DNA-binding Lrp family transcriptional regulator
VVMKETIDSKILENLQRNARVSISTEQTGQSVIVSCQRRLRTRRPLVLSNVYTVILESKPGQELTD